MLAGSECFGYCKIARELELGVWSHICGNGQQNDGDEEVRPCALSGL